MLNLKTMMMMRTNFYFLSFSGESGNGGWETAIFGHLILGTTTDTVQRRLEALEGIQILMKPRGGWPREGSRGV
jgi:hypothetical protein